MSKLSKSLYRSIVGLSAFILTAASSPATYAEDIEIYTGLTNESFAEQEFKPNLLFVLDTSGSMNISEAVLNARPLYDPDRNYGDASDNNVYIYAEDRQYTGMFVDSSDNNCRHSVETHIANPQFPEYFDQAVVWRNDVTTTVTQQCTVGDPVPQTLRIDSTNQNAQVRESTLFTFEPDTTYDITLQPDTGNFTGRLFFRRGISNNAGALDVVDPGNGGSQLEFDVRQECEASTSFTSQSPRTCTISIPPAPTTIVSAIVDITQNGGTNGGSTGITITAIPTNGAGSSVPVCVDVTTTTVGNPNWVVDVNANEVDQITALECEEDSQDESDGHGSNAAPTPEIFPQLQESLNTSGEPNYTTSSSNPNILDWDNDIYVNRYIFPANYHAYLQSPVSDLIQDIPGVSIIDLDTVGSITTTRDDGGQRTHDTATEVCQAGQGTSEPRFFHNQYVIDNGEIFQCITRIRQLKQAAYNILSTIEGVRVGIMRFNRDAGGVLVNGVVDIDEGNNRQELIEALMSLPAGGFTPLQETLLEARRYFGGLNVENENAQKNVVDDDIRVELVDNGAFGISLFDNQNRRVRLYENDSLNETQHRFDDTFEVARSNGNVDLRDRNNNNFNRATNVSLDVLNADPLYEITTDITNSTSTTSILDRSATEVVGNQRRYITPIESECQDNTIVFLSDGQPTNDSNSGDRSDIESFSGENCGSGDGQCLDELAFGLATQDVNATISGENNVFLNTVFLGSSSGNDVLLEASNRGLRPGNVPGSQHFQASTADDLTTAFQSIFQNLVSVQADSFVAPAVTVNAFSRLEFRDDLYFAVFEPNNSPRWNGNIKRYRINTDGDILDQDGQIATDNDGFFSDNARSFWSATADGASVTEGAFASNLDVGERRLYANIDSRGNSNVVQLTRDNFLETITNPAVSTVSSLGALGTGTLGDIQGELDSGDINLNADEIIRWTFGEDVEQDLGGAATDSNFYVGETLHGSPFVLDYGTSTTPEDVVFAFTNQGILHAIDGDNGEELWAYIPDDSLFENLGDYYNNTAAAPHVYGVDGEITFDVERDPVTQEVDEAVIFVGQRRGGSKYFAIDILNGNQTASPVDNKWTVSDLPRMGQSWATPVLSNINFCTDGDDPDSCESREVLVLAGGYDTAYDRFEDANGNRISVDSFAGNVTGNAIYMVDRNSGELLWMAGRPSEVPTSITTNLGNNSEYGYYTNDEMLHSFPTEPTMIDADFDGVDDLMYIVDVAGRLWRFDFRGNIQVDDAGTPTVPADDIFTFDENDIIFGDNGGLDPNTGSNLSDNEVSAGIIAELAQNGVDQRFFNHLDISFTGRTETDLARYNIVVGSGYRARPRAPEGDANRIYFVFDRNLQFPQLTTNAVGVVDGITYNYVDPDADENINSDDLDSIATGTILDSALTNRHGFHVDLFNSDEKMLNPTITDEGIVLAVSYAPTQDVFLNGQTQNIICQRDTGSSLLYQIDLLTGESAALELDSDGISSQPLIIELAGDDGEISKVLVVGTEAFDFSKPAVINGDNLESPGGNESSLGRVRREQWWERARSLVE